MARNNNTRDMLPTMTAEFEEELKKLMGEIGEKLKKSTDEESFMYLSKIKAEYTAQRTIRIQAHFNWIDPLLDTSKRMGGTARPGSGFSDIDKIYFKFLEYVDSLLLKVFDGYSREYLRRLDGTPHLLLYFLQLKWWKREDVLEADNPEVISAKLDYEQWKEGFEVIAEVVKG